MTTRPLTMTAQRLLALIVANDALAQTPTSNGDASKEEPEVAVPEITTGDIRPWMMSTVEPRPWESKNPASEELEKIRELVQPREGESVYEAVYALFEYAKQR